jgi:hypothetical protein
MVLGSVDKSITYPKSIYYSAQPYGFGYFENGLMIEPPSWDDETNRWLASLFGLKYERIIPPRNVDPDKAWSDYLNRLETALKAGYAVQTCRGWMAVKEEGGKITSEMGGRLFWWEGLSKRHRPNMHYFTIIGIDRSQGKVYFHDPVFGWYGWGKDVSVHIESLRRAVERAPWQHRYITVAFKPADKPAKTEEEMQRLLHERIIKKIEGDPSVYNAMDMWRSFFGLEKLTRNFLHGIRGLEAFRRDLQPERFKRILALKLQRRKMQPASVVSWIDLNVYHRAWVTLIGAEYLEEAGQMEEWQWLFRLHMLYEQMWVSTSKLRSIFKVTNDVDAAMPRVRPVLMNMQRTIDEMIHHFQLYKREKL